MTPRLFELLDLAARWIHVIASIMWVGNSLLFNWLDRTLAPPSRPGAGRLGESWLLHSGGFYFVEKTQLVGERLPERLHWFKWQAYTTWLSGATLLVVVFYAGGRAAMEDPSVAAISHGTAVMIGASAVLGGVAIYELVQRLLAPRAPLAANVLLGASLIAVVYALTHLLSGRAAFLHVGAMLASVMAGNVAMTIVPSQRALVRSVTGGAGADDAVSARAKRVSVYNNYITFPVVALMVSGHFSALYSHRWSWVILLVLIVAGAGVRHALNVRFHAPGWRLGLAAAIGIPAVVLWSLLSFLPASESPSRAPAASVLADPGPVSFADARHVIDRRCAACHSTSPSDSSFGAAPAGVTFDLPAQIRSHAGRILERAVRTRTMPPANRTHITEQERALLGRWVEQGARIP